MAQKRNTTPGAKTRETVLHAAADVASIDGLDGLTIGHLASLTGMSKSGLFAHFGSKQDLQLATIEVARQRYVREVVTPALGSGPGMQRLTALCESFLSYVERGVFPGGCFFAAAMAEFDGKRPGPVRDAVAECQRQWMGTLAQAAREAQQSGELCTDTDPDQLAFELEGTLLAANSYFHLFADTRYLDRARLAVRTRLASGESTPERTATRA
ncbi:TetR family transcriptional regulator C-terminal domain-containing protein [Rhodococcus wratislaviensis]|uniref:TetR family transcriptional regulator C-terminal domain-containing protein n=1 Tax=Rhodococcus wratislaviensis TaxID=44752 RepID=UPI0036608801